VDWITYNEAEAHLDTVATEISGRISSLQNPNIFGLSYKDTSLLARLQKMGHANVHALSIEQMGITNKCAGIESIQHAFTPERAEKIAREFGKADVIVARHLLEHAHDQKKFVTALKTLLKPDGWLVLEVPDASLAVSTLDYSTIWEEHVVYFTPESFTWAIGQFSFSLKKFFNFPYPLENALVGICQLGAGVKKSNRPDEIETYKETAARYRDQFSARRSETQATLDRARGESGNIAMFGAGHLAGKYINFLELDQRISMVIDDHPKKNGMFMPGSRLPIVGSEQLLQGGIKLCLTSLNPESEAKVRNKYASYLESGGTFASIFPASPSAFLRIKH
jgi:SAM-dependent methyltransferase